MQLQKEMPAYEPEIVREHADWLVVNKPAHLLIHPTRPDGQFTLLEWVKGKFPGEQLAIVNRLDRETSGLVLVARSSLAASTLGKMTMRRQIAKKYLAIVWGEAPESGSVLAPLDRQNKHRPSVIHVKQAVIEGTYNAVTHFKRLEMKRGANGEVFSLLEVELETGRLHQIRIHLSHIGHPVIGDKIYGPNEMFYLDFIEKGWTEEMQQALLLKRHALHASSLAFDWNDEPFAISVPLPADLRAFWDNLD
ncbi:MAG: RNA pseudouridine synthase [Verrucomicrobiales bacterium]|nr:RNA pseudouridine synthase [Verrucomicrobiales bacterium]